MFICSDFFAKLGGPSRRNVSLFFLGKFKVILLDRSSLCAAAKVTDPISIYSILYSGK